MVGYFRSKSVATLYPPPQQDRVSAPLVHWASATRDEVVDDAEVGEEDSTTNGEALDTMVEVLEILAVVVVAALVVVDDALEVVELVLEEVLEVVEARRTSLPMRSAPHR